MTTLTVQVALADEDGFITFGDGYGMGDTETLTNNAKVRIGRDATTPEDYFGWVHLKNLTIAQGATINNAKLYLYWNASSGFGTLDPSEGMTVKAEDIDSASKPTTYAAVNGWTLTSASATVSSFIDAEDYNMDGLPDEEFAAGWYPSAGLEIKTVLQELVNRGSWSSGSNLNLKLTPSAHDGSNDWTIDWTDRDTSSSLAPKLVIDYTAAAESAATSPAFSLFVDF